jgi:uncharacterized membrane protein
MKKVFLYIMFVVYAAGGIYHFVNPDFYKSIMPDWLPQHTLLNGLGGISEIILALMLLPESTRKTSSYLIIAMLVIFLVVIHIPMAIDFYKKDHPALWIAIIRIPIQFVLIWWAWLYTRPLKS